MGVQPELCLNWLEPPKTGLCMKHRSGSLGYSAHSKTLELMHLSIFSAMRGVCVWGGGGGVGGQDTHGELDNFEKLGSNSPA